MTFALLVTVNMRQDITLITFVKQLLRTTARFFYKNTVYKNVQDEIGQKIKNVLRILTS